MSTLSLRLPYSLHHTVKNLAKKEEISINQLVATAVAEKISALMTESYLQKRAKKGNRKKFDKAMAKVSNAKPRKEDSWNED